MLQPTWPGLRKYKYRHQKQHGNSSGVSQQGLMHLVNCSARQCRNKPAAPLTQALLAAYQAGRLGLFPR